MTQTAPFGTWSSPITPDALVSGATSVSDAMADNASVFWSESRPTEGGRTAILRYHDGAITEVTPTSSNVRTTVHEYGGGCWTVADDVVYFVEYVDQQVHFIDLHGAAGTLTPAPEAGLTLRFADFTVTLDRRWLIAVCEQHRHGNKEAANTLVAIPTDGSMRLVTLCEGSDFYSAPRLSPDNSRLAWIEWQHPNMPWDDTSLQCASLVLNADSIALSDTRLVAGGSDESIVQPEFSPSGELHFLSDREDTWQLYKEVLQPGAETHAHQLVLQADGEIGTPPWVFSQSRYAFRPDGSLVFAYVNGGVDYMDGYPDLSSFRAIRCNAGTSTWIASGWHNEAVVFCNGQAISPQRDLARDLGIGNSLLLAAEKITFDTDQGEQSHALFFAPANPDYRAPAAEKPPLIVLAHGGPTASARSELNLARQFWTSRGFAVVDVNYRGSSGFGRAYRQKLNRAWGVADVSDCVNAARFLVDRGDVDPERLIIRGGSAGGFTVLSALAFHNVFTAGANLYGVADLEALAEDTHKFESRYLDNLVGPYPEQKSRYRARSPIHHLDGFDAPMIVLQGSEDAIVPPNQSRMIVEALNARKVPVAYLEFAGEQHGFRQAGTIRTALASELAFYGKVFGFDPPDCDVELTIMNLPADA